MEHYLILPLQDKHICDAPKRNSQMDDLGFSDFIRNVTDVYHPGGFEFGLLTVQFGLKRKRNSRNGSVFLFKNKCPNDLKVPYEIVINPRPTWKIVALVSSYFIN